MMRRSRLLLNCCLALFSPISLLQAERIQGPYGPNNTWNVYDVVSTAATWRDAQLDAESRHWNQFPGQLVDIASADENRFVEHLTARYGWNGTWLGLTDREGAAPPTWVGGLPAPQESRSLDDPQRQGWAWTSGTPLTYTNWARNEPIDFRGVEDAAFLAADGTWNDLGSGFAADEPAPPALQPGTAGDETAVRLNPYLIEYQTGSTSPWPGIDRLANPPRMPVDLSSPLGASDGLTVVDYRGTFVVPDRISIVSAMISQIAQGLLTADGFTANIPYADVTDPETRGTGGPILEGVPFRFPSDQAAVNDDQMISIARGTLLVPESGSYTIQVRSSAGFALQIDDRPFQSVSGAGHIDDSDPSVMYFGAYTTDSDTRGVIELTAGTHELRFYSWSSVGPAYWEITSALGAVVHDTDAQWLAIGDTRELPARQLHSPVQLVGPARVVNAHEENSTVPGSIDAARAMIATAEREGTAWVRDDLTTVALRDEDGICCDRPGTDLDESLVFLWPLNDSTYGGNDLPHDYFSSAVSGRFTVDDGDDVAGEMLQLTFGVYASDGVELHVAGSSFESASPSAILTLNPDDDMMLTSAGSSSSTTMQGLIQLAEGTEHRFEAVHFDNKGDAGLEIWVALGDYLAAFDSDAFFPLSSVLSDRVLPLNRGLGLIAGQDAVRGDFDGDKTLDVRDLDLLVAAFLTAVAPFDLDASGVVDQYDLFVWVHDLMHTWIGDADLNGVFSTSDLVQVLAAGKYETGEPARWSEGDWNGDQRFSTSDLVAALQDGGYEQGERPLRLATVPEPTSGWSLAMLLGGFIGMAKRRAICCR